MPIITSFKPVLHIVGTLLNAQIPNAGSCFTLDQFVRTKSVLDTLNAVPKIAVYNNDRIAPEMLFDDSKVSSTYDYPQEARRINGNPKRTDWAHLEDHTKGLYSGTWASETGSWRFTFPKNQTEYFLVREGKIRLHDENGYVTEIVAGQSAIIPPGFSGIFEIVEPVRKQYTVVIRQSPNN